MNVSRFTIFTENLVICCYQVTKIFCTRNGSAIASSARRPCNVGPLTDLAISQLLTSLGRGLLKIVHEKNWRVSLCVQELSSTRFSLTSCSHSGISGLNVARPESANNGFHRSIVVSSLFVFRFWLAWGRIPGSAANNGSHRSIISSTCELDTGTGGESIPVRSSLSRISLLLGAVVVGDEDELEEDVEQCLSCLEGVIEVEG